MSPKTPFSSTSPSHLLDKLKTVLLLLTLRVHRLRDLYACSDQTNSFRPRPDIYILSGSCNDISHLCHSMTHSMTYGAPVYAHSWRIFQSRKSPIFEHSVITAAPYFPCVEIQHRGINSNMHLPTFGSPFKSVIRYLGCCLLTSSLSSSTPLFGLWIR